MHESSAAQDRSLIVDPAPRHDDEKTINRTPRSASEEIRTVWKEGRFFQVFWELKVLVWGLPAIAVAYAATYWLYAR